ncbi:hypothetical protein BVG19_g4255 [[Candida] boidinii]|nr:hypothetical protein BVG19_g4255 [[Candida] boidinii]OWB51106.1 hypothetical protein B5S27_g2664 [[Candida] boidinii]
MSTVITQTNKTLLSIDPLSPLNQSRTREIGADSETIDQINSNSNSNSNSHSHKNHISKNSNELSIKSDNLSQNINGTTLIGEDFEQINMFEKYDIKIKKSDNLKDNEDGAILNEGVLALLHDEKTSKLTTSSTVSTRSNSGPTSTNYLSNNIISSPATIDTELGDESTGLLTFNNNNNNTDNNNNNIDTIDNFNSEVHGEQELNNQIVINPQSNNVIPLASNINTTESDTGIITTSTGVTPRERRVSISLPKTKSNTLVTTTGANKYSNINPNVNSSSTNLSYRGKLKNRNPPAKRKSRSKNHGEVVHMPGQRVKEDDPNFNKVYCMITGIRVAVSKCSKMPHPIVDEDFHLTEKFMFDMEGSQLTPSTKYDFKFKDYAPEVFRRLRQIFDIDPSDYLMSIAENTCVSKQGSPGKSGSFFYYSKDYRYIIKTIHHAEHKQLRRVIKEYYQYVEDNPDTFISQFYGLHRLKLYGKGGRIQKVHFIVMNNIFPPHKELHEKFDLKGSTFGRITNVSKATENGKSKKTLVLKDLNWMQEDKQMKFGPTKRKAIYGQLAKDIELLKKLNIMDYSLLLGIHDVKQAEADDPEHKLDNFQPVGYNKTSNNTTSNNNNDNHFNVDKRPSVITNDSIYRSNTFSSQLSNGTTTIPLPASTNINNDPVLEDVDEDNPDVENIQEYSGQQRPQVDDDNNNIVENKISANTTSQPLLHRTSTVYMEEDGGFHATDENDEELPIIYYMGVIDCLTNYSTIKRLETFWRSLKHKRETISAVPPNEYGDRFLKFMKKAMTPRSKKKDQKKETY